MELKEKRDFQGPSKTSPNEEEFLEEEQEEEDREKEMEVALNWELKPEGTQIQDRVAIS